MSVKLMMTWDIAPKKNRIISSLSSGNSSLPCSGWEFQPVEAWATIYGDYPQIQVGILAEDLPGVQQVLHTDGWI